MHRYSFDNCPVCGLSFTENDDIVVCPSCGTPHHRECYEKEGTCANSALHDEGFTFESAAPQTDEVKSTADSVKSEDASAGGSNNEHSDSEADNPFNSVFGPSVHDGELIDGVPIGDLKKFIGPAWVYYIPLAYAKLKGMRVFRINFSAFIGSYIWLFARKFYLLGTISALLSLASYLYMYFYLNFLKSVGIDPAASVAELIVPNGDMRVTVGYYIYLAATNLPFIISLLTALFANNMYMNNAVKKVRQINKKATTAEEFNSKLEKKGGINMPLMFISLAVTVCYYILESRGIINDLMARLVNFIM